MSKVKVYLLHSGQVLIGELNGDILSNVLTPVFTPQGNTVSIEFVPVLYPINVEPLDIEVKNLQYLVELKEDKPQIKSLIQNYNESLLQLKPSVIIEPKSKLIY